MKFATLHSIGDKVYVDDDRHIYSTITAISIRGPLMAVEYECCWFHNGDQNRAWIEEFRVHPE